MLGAMTTPCGDAPVTQSLWGVTGPIAGGAVIRVHSFGGEPVDVTVGKVIDNRDQDGTFTIEPLEADQPISDVYVVHTPKGFTETFDARTIETLEQLGLIRHERDGHVLEDGRGNGAGPLHRFYCEATR